MLEGDSLGWAERDRKFYKERITAIHLAGFDRSAVPDLDCDLVGTPNASGAWPTPRRLRQAHGQVKKRKKVSQQGEYNGSRQNL
ncbi:MAG: hypothetical protein MZV64_60395 [Ignavibacteriales bacterium]|nr:hypothetical protein [Ignavibacteriales bacterium]